MIYLVEDDESIRELVVYTLKSQGMEAKGFERPSQFWKELDKEIPSLILLDVMLPEEDGISILKKLRTRPDTRKLPIIMLTAKGSEYDVVMGLENRIIYNLVDVVEGNCRMKQALIRDKRYPNLYLLPSAQTRDKSSVNPGQMKKLVDDLREEFDYILLDCPAGIEQGFQNAIAGADRALVVTTPEVSSIRDADRIIGLLEQNQIHTIDLIINRIRMDMVKRGDMMSVDDVTEILAVPLIGILPDDEQVVIGTNQGEPVIGLDSKAGKGYLNICKRITGTEVSFMNLDTGKGLFSRISHAFRKN